MSYDQFEQPQRHDDDPYSGLKLGGKFAGAMAAIYGAGDWLQHNASGIYEHKQGAMNMHDRLAPLEAIVGAHAQDVLYMASVAIQHVIR